MDSKLIIQSAYSLVLFNILNIIQHDDDGDCDWEHCGSNMYQYFDYFMITYLPYDDEYPRTGSFFITFYDKYPMKLIKEAMIEVHQFWKKDVEYVLERCDNNWVVDIEDDAKTSEHDLSCVSEDDENYSDSDGSTLSESTSGLSKKAKLTLQNTLGLVDPDNFLMKPINDYTFMTLFTVANYFDCYRTSPIVPNHLVNHFIVNEPSSFQYLEKIRYNEDEEYNYERITERGHQKNYIFDDSFSTMIWKNKKRIGIPTHDFPSIPYIRNDMDNIIMVKSYAHMADKIIQKDFDYFFNEHYAIRFMKNSGNQYFVILEFSKSYTYEMVSKCIHFMNRLIENEIEESEFIDNYDNLRFMKPIHNKLFFSVIEYSDIETKPDFSTQFLQDIYQGEFQLNEEEYNVEIEYDHFRFHRYRPYNYSLKFEVPDFKYTEY